MPQTDTTTLWQDLIPKGFVMESKVDHRENAEPIDAVCTRAQTVQSAKNAQSMRRPFSKIVDLADALSKTTPMEWYGKYIIFPGTELVDKEHGRNCCVLYLYCDKHGRKTHGRVGLSESFKTLSEDLSDVLIAFVAQ